MVKHDLTNFAKELSCLQILPKFILLCPEQTIITNPQHIQQKLLHTLEIQEFQQFKNKVVFAELDCWVAGRSFPVVQQQEVQSFNYVVYVRDVGLLFHVLKSAVQSFD